MSIGQFYQYRDMYDRCQACKSCLDKGYLAMPFEQRRLPVPWQGTVGSQVRVLFLFTRPSFTKFSPRLSDYPNAPGLRAMLDRHYEAHAIAFKRRRAVDGSLRSHARRIAAILLETPEAAISDFDDYLFTSLMRCNDDLQGAARSLEPIATECLSRHGAPLIKHLPNLQWVVLVGRTAHRLLSQHNAWMKFREVFRVRDTIRNLELPPLVCGVSEVIALNEHVGLIAVPHFSRTSFTAEHFRRIFASWMTRQSLPGEGLHPIVPGAPRAAVRH